MDRPNYRITDADEGPTCASCLWLVQWPAHPPKCLLTRFTVSGPMAAVRLDAVCDGHQMPRGRA